MTQAARKSDFIQAHASPPAGMLFYDSLRSVLSDRNLLGYWSVIKRAWDELRLQGVLCLDGRPILYLKEHNRPFTPDKRIRLQKLFWNQGVANVLVLADPLAVYIYSGLARPRDTVPSKEEKEEALVDIKPIVDYIQHTKFFFHSLATGHYFEEKKDCFAHEQAVDNRLLQNLRSLRKNLTTGDEGLNIQKAHAFIGRILFLCYLLDRKIVTIGKLQKGQTGTMLLSEILTSNDSPLDYLYSLFSELKDQFNGNMFDQNLDTEKNDITATHLEILTQFLGGHDVVRKQKTLGFWAYDFKMIPVETISAIYQDFLADEDKDRQRKRGAIYTPRFLAEMVVDTAIDNKEEAFQWTFLDPSCGSGIFLVILFNRLANNWLHHAGSIDYSKKAEGLLDILSRQIKGVDIEDTACRISCFSLYLAYLDFFDPPDIIEYIDKTGHPLPKLLHATNRSDQFRNDMSVIHHADFINERPLSDTNFDCIIGNPPWVERQSKQLAQKFMEIAPDYLKQGGVGCFLLPTKIIQNQTDQFQANWLSQVTLEKVLQLSDYRKLLFKGARSPAFIARFFNTKPDINNHQIEFNAPKFNRNGVRQGMITVNPSDVKWFSQIDILNAAKEKKAPVYWKRRLWGTGRDQKFLNLLESLPKLSDIAGEPKDKKRWIKGQGFQPYYPEKASNNTRYPNPKPHLWNPEDLYLDARKEFKVSIFKFECTMLNEKLKELKASTKYMRMLPDLKIFKPPKVLISHGFGKVAFCDFDVLFQHSLQSISGPSEDADLLIFLTVYLRSNLARYYLFHTAGNWGSERDKVHLNELLRVPFILPSHEFAAIDANKIVQTIVKKFKKLNNKLLKTYERLKSELLSGDLFGAINEKENKAFEKEWRGEQKIFVDQLQKEIEFLIYQYFGLTDQEIILIEDTIRIFEISSTPNTWRSPQTVTLDPVDQTKVVPYATQGLAAYADTLIETLNNWAQAEGSNYRVHAEGGIDEVSGLTMVTIGMSHYEKPFKLKDLSNNLMDALFDLHNITAMQEGKLHYERDLFVFRNERIHIVRPNMLINWTRTAALNDAARIYGEIVTATEDV